MKRLNQRNQYFRQLLIFLAILFYTAEINAADAEANGTLIGKIQEIETRESVGWVTIYLEEINRSISSHEDGTFHFFELPPGTYTLKAFRVGFKDFEMKVTIEEHYTTTVTLNLEPGSLYTEAIVVESDQYSTRVGLENTTNTISGKKLRQSLGRTIAETIDYEPGLSQRTMGPAPARPVLRGLGGDRLLILEDGQRTGDLSGTAADHAVVVEPVTAQRIEVTRGPQALIYGSNTLGGVINIVRDYIPTVLPHHLTGSATLQGESVNNGYVSGLNLNFPVGQFAFQADASFRHASDVSTPKGNLKNTSIQTSNYSAGTGYYRPKWYTGISFNQYLSAYGIPPDPNGGHPNGVDIEIDRKHYESKAEYLPEKTPLRQVKLHYTYSRYYHKEIESTGYVGGEFGVLTHTMELENRLRNSGFLQNGIFGFWSEYRDYASGGLNYTPNTIEHAWAFFYYQELNFKRLAANGAIRYDRKDINPDETRYSRFLEGTIRKRQFDGFSSSASLKYKFIPALAAGMGVMHSFRAPGVEELFSEGPHAAAYAYEVGNANLNSERGLGLELFMEYQGMSGTVRLALFRNDIQNYVFPEDQNKRSPQRNDLQLYKYVGDHVLMQGFELAGDFKVTSRLHSGLSVSYVRGDRIKKDEPLPRIPPLEGKWNIRYEMKKLSIGSTLRAADDQTRVGEFEKRTNGYMVLDFDVQYLVNFGNLLHTLVFSIQNATDSEYYKHLNRIKEVMPEPGRNFKLLYRLYF